MAQRTYLPTLLALLRLICSYVGKNRTRIVRFIGTENVEALDAMIFACEALADILDTIVQSGD